MQQFWADDLLAWETEGIDRSDSSLQDVDYGYAKWSDDRGSFYHTQPEGLGVSSLGYVNQKIDSDIKLVVTETEVIWSWDGFHAKRNTNLTELRQTIDMRKKEYYPFFLLPGCEEDQDFSAVEIISSKVGRA